MRFRLLFLIFIFGCGIKGPPVSEKETIIPSYIEQHTKPIQE